MRPGKPKPRVALVDRALPPARFERLLRALTALGTERLRASYQTTFWFDLSAPPSNLVEEAALTLRTHVPAARRRDVVGLEWWLSRMRTSNVKVDFHHDRDNGLFDRTGREVLPRLSSVFYLNRCRGGLLAVTAEPPNPANPALAPDVHDFDFVTPEPNRYAFFDARLTHGVLDARNQLPGQRLPTEPGWRLAIAVNYWHRRPEGVPTFEESGHYRALALAPPTSAPRAPRRRAPRAPGA
jgi:hypothetical protein